VHAGLQVQLEQRVRRHLGQILDLDDLAPCTALAEERFAEPDRMRT
jgi:hypothetical protein